MNEDVSKWATNERKLGIFFKQFHEHFLFKSLRYVMFSRMENDFLVHHVGSTLSVRGFDVRRHNLTSTDVRF